MAQTPDIPEKYSWAWEEEPLSSHQADLVGKFRYSTPQYFMAAFCLGISCIGFLVPAKEGPVVAYTVGGVSIAAAAALIAWGVILANGVVSLVDVYPSGILWLHQGRWFGGRWEEIDEVTRTEIRVNGRMRTRKVTVLTRGKVKGELHHVLSRWGEMADAIVMQTTMRQVPVALERFDAGETILFGGAAINREELRIGKSRYRFDSMKKLEIRNGNLVVYMHGSRDAVNAVSFADMPNYMVFLKLLEVSEAPKLTMGG